METSKLFWLGNRWPYRRRYFSLPLFLQVHSAAGHLLWSPLPLYFHLQGKKFPPKFFLTYSVISAWLLSSLQQKFAGNLLLRLAREASKPAFQVAKLKVFNFPPVLHILSSSPIPGSVTEHLFGIFSPSA